MDYFSLFSNPTAVEQDNGGPFAKLFPQSSNVGSKPAEMVMPAPSMSTPPEWAQSIVKGMAAPIMDAGSYLGGLMGGQIPFHPAEAMQQAAALGSSLIGPKLGAGTIAAMAAPIAKAGTRLAPAGERVVGGLRPYQNVPDSLMGYKRFGQQKGFDQENYRHIQNVEVTLDNGDKFVDAIKGLNKTHAVERAHRNWPGAEIKAISEPGS